MGTTAEPLDKNRLRIFQPTLGFLSAIGGRYGNYERGYPQVLNRLVLKGFIWWGFCQFILAWYLVVKEAGGKKTLLVPILFFRRRHCKQSYRPDIPPCHGLKVFWRGTVLGCNGGGRKEQLFRRRKVFSGAGIPNWAIGQIFHHARAFICFLGVALGCKRGGRKKNTF